MNRFGVSGLVVVLGLAAATQAHAWNPFKKKTPPPQPPVVTNPVVIVPQVVAGPEIRLYQLMGAQSLWTVNGAWLASTQTLREVLINAPNEGLAAEYWTQDLENMIQTRDPQQAAQFDVLATQALMKYATHLINGHVDPATVGTEIKVKAKAAPYDQVAAALKDTTQDLRGQLESLSPNWVIYKNLRVALQRLSAVDAATAWPVVQAPAKRAKLGDMGVLFANLKVRLQTLGYPVSETGIVYTPELRDLVKQYVAGQTLPGASDLSSGTFWKHMAVPLEARRQQIRMSMEKIRWMPHAPEDKHIFVNLALQHFRLFEGAQVVMDMKTVNGKSQRMSPMLRDKIYGLELNPDWTVPAKLIIEDKIPAIQKDPNFLAEHHFLIYDSSFKHQIDPTTIDWAAIAATAAATNTADPTADKENVGIYLQQQPGLGSALGIMKFELTNPYAIYLHDTNERELFAENHRLLSSGCIRLEHPLDLAHYLLKDDPKWNVPGFLESKLATTEFADDTVEKRLQVHLKSSMPVYLMSITADVDASGVVQFANDYYGQDLRLFNALKAEHDGVRAAEELGPIY